MSMLCTWKYEKKVGYFSKMKKKIPNCFDFPNGPKLKTYLAIQPSLYVYQVRVPCCTWSIKDTRMYVHTYSLCTLKALYQFWLDLDRKSQRENDAIYKSRRGGAIILRRYFPAWEVVQKLRWFGYTGCSLFVIWYYDWKATFMEAPGPCLETQSPV